MREMTLASSIVTVIAPLSMGVSHPVKLADFQPREACCRQLKSWPQFGPHALSLTPL
jgi:hypothetical protein